MLAVTTTFPTTFSLKSRCAELMFGPEFTDKDKEYLVNLEAGCERHSGPGACPIRVIKRSEGNYHVICKRKTS